MQIKIFKISADDGGGMQEKMNRFLRGHRVLSMQQELVSNAMGISWCFCIRYLEGSKPTTTFGKKARVDYRAILSEQAFAVFSDLRKCRKEIAEELNEKIYMVFTNEELAKMTELEELTLNNVAKIKGIGEQKLKKYVVPLLDKYKEIQSNEAIG